MVFSPSVKVSLARALPSSAVTTITHGWEIAIKDKHFLPGSEGHRVLEEAPLTVCSGKD